MIFSFIPLLLLVKTLQSNDALKEKIDNLLLPNIRDLSVPIKGGYRELIRLLSINDIILSMNFFMPTSLLD